jgi:hypothetical protein
MTEMTAPLLSDLYGRNREAQPVFSESDPVNQLVAANTHVSNPLTNGNCRGFLCTVAGDLACRPVGNAADVTIAIEKGWHPLSLSHVRASGTTATIFVGY